MSTQQQQQSKEHRKHQKGGGQRHISAKLRGLPKDSPEVRLSKTLSWVLRHGSQSEGLYMRPDGYVRVNELLNLPRLQSLDIPGLQQIVESDSKNRYNMIREPDKASNSSGAIWWIRANQGHSLKDVTVEVQPITSASNIPTGIAVHGTTRKAWETIRKEGLSKMTRNHIHLAQGVPGSGVISGMRNSSAILIYVDLQKALDAGIKFYLSANGVVLTDGDGKGYLGPQFFQRIEDAKTGKPVTDWQVSQSDSGIGGANATAIQSVPENLVKEGSTTTEN